MRLTDLDPRWVGHGGEGVFDAEHKPIPWREGVAVSFDCPCGCEFPLCVVFANPIGGGPAIQEKPVWQRTGETFETLTLSPSIRRSKERGGCGWHGYVEQGGIRTLPDGPPERVRTSSAT